MICGVCSVASFLFVFFFFQAEDGIRDLVRSRGLGDVYKRQSIYWSICECAGEFCPILLYNILMSEFNRNR